MTRVWQWLRRDFLGAARWRWIACLLLAAVAAWVARSWLASAWGLLALVPVRRVPVVEPAPDPAPAALEAHRASQERRDALRTVSAEARAAGDVGRQRAMTDPADEVAARVAAMGRERKP